MAASETNPDLRSSAPANWLILPIKSVLLNLIVPLFSVSKTVLLYKVVMLLLYFVRRVRYNCQKWAVCCGI